MGRSKKRHNLELPKLLSEYANSRNLDFAHYSAYHMRLMDGGYTIIDIWTTERYWIMTTDYLEMVGEGIPERSNEKGMLPMNKLNKWLDELFFPEADNG